MMNTADNFSFITKKQLNRQEQKAAEHLAALCRSHDSILLSYPTEPEEADCHYLAYPVSRKKESGSAADAMQASSVGAIPAAALAVTVFDENTVGCAAFTAPEFRRHGLFLQLLDAAVGDFPDSDFLFAVSEDCPDTLAALDAVGAEFEHREYTMEICLPDNSGSGISASQSGNTAKDKVGPAGVNHQAAHPAQIGTYELTPVSDTCVCLHHVEIPEHLRGQGYGTLLMQNMLSELSGSGAKKVILQVDGDNAAALALYKKTGFRISETLSYYLY